jgi:fructose-1,6-bisphosphatase/inositol monophosphatase family enzyme
MIDRARLEAIVREAGHMAMARWPGGEGTGGGPLEVWEKTPGDPVSEVDLAVDAFLRRELMALLPAAGWLSEETVDAPERLSGGLIWLVDPIDGTRGFARGIPLMTTLIALVDGDEPLVGLIDVPALDERYLGWRGGGCRRNGVPTRVSQESDLRRAIVSHGDPFTFDLYGERPAFERMAREIPLLRGYTDAFGHSQVLAGGVGAMVDLCLNPWDMAATRLLVPEAGGRCERLASRAGKGGLVLGAPALVEELLGFLSVGIG